MQPFGFQRSPTEGRRAIETARALAARGRRNGFDVDAHAIR